MARSLLEIFWTRNSGIDSPRGSGSHDWLFFICKHSSDWRDCVPAHRDWRIRPILSSFYPFLTSQVSDIDILYFFSYSEFLHNQPSRDYFSYKSKPLVNYCLSCKAEKTITFFLGHHRPLLGVLCGVPQVISDLYKFKGS
jgi:hypothetical protein